jgi:hypothetical protein
MMPRFQHYFAYFIEMLYGCHSLRKHENYNNESKEWHPILLVDVVDIASIASSFRLCLSSREIYDYDWCNLYESLEAKSRISCWQWQSPPKKRGVCDLGDLTCSDEQASLPSRQVWQTVYLVSHLNKGLIAKISGRLAGRKCGGKGIWRRVNKDVENNMIKVGRLWLFPAHDEIDDGLEESGDNLTCHFCFACC